MTITEVGEIIVRIDPEENWYAALAQAAAEAEKRGLGLRLVLPVAPQRDPLRAGEGRGATMNCRGQSSQESDQCCGDDVRRSEQDGSPQ
ncbi:hypothetical protein [Streptomyces antarcticus]|uniref:hypothetical protein n=1 Tax=Streptomyces antarcticus TaxID=2996458 RepID=UPI0022700261|nr:MULTISPECIES: hypothetical protein [unclassified Streptomyces]MCY0944492.1 hypothetical protein [Streptomyces sp. H34-AA3]MCZ4084521.1 hypothetical protein [Streptomyces sp. H34-S5]